jgi:O-antigen/teichoic acid export membrane protein
MNLARRSVTSVAWNSVANWLSIIVLFLRAVLLARWLPVEVFGVYALANSVVQITVTLTTFGMGGAFVHRTKETQDEETAATNFFTLNLIFILIWGSILTFFSALVTSGQLQLALLVLTTSIGLKQLAQIPKTILTRRVVHRRLALVKVTDAVITTILVLWLAWRGMTLWALLSSSISSLLVTTFLFYIWRPIWRPRLALSFQVVRYFLRFGSQTLVASLLYRVLDRVDDIWTGFYLGETALGFYSRAYNFAIYPRRILAEPVNSVAIGTYAELKTDRIRLSKAFFRANALLVRTGFFIAGLLALIAPEFIRLVLGEKWFPMLYAFRLMLVFTMLDPIKVTIANLFIAVGEPKKLVWIRAMQFIVLAASLYILGPNFGIIGVALAVDIMLVIGIILLLREIRNFVDLSIRTLFFAPLIALVAGMVLARGSLLIPGVLGSDWRTAGIKIFIYIVIFGFIMFLLERRRIYLIADLFPRLSSSLWHRRGMPDDTT